MALEKVQVNIPDDDYWRRQIKCQHACPVGTDARGYVRAIAAGDFEKAYWIARGPNPLASICGRVCGAPCEAACRRGAIDQAISIRALKRFVTEKYGPESFSQETLKPIELLKRVFGAGRGRERDSEETERLASLSGFSGDFKLPNAKGEQVAIIGSGPAGLAAAHDLALLGFRPTVYEMEPIPAGMLAVGIPEYRLPRELIRAEVEVIRSLGVEFICNTQVGKDISLAEIRRRHRATIIAIGAKRSRTLPLPGGDGPGVLGGVEFLRDVALRNRSAASTLNQLGRRIVVIGGGNVAFDVSRTVIRQTGFDISRSALRQVKGAEVHMCCLESLEEMPADDVEILEGHEEGVRLHTSLGPVEVVRGTSGAITGMKFKRCLSVFDEEGRFAPRFNEQEMTTIPADTVLWAIGQRADLSLIEKDSGIRLLERGGIEVNPQTLQTSAPDIFLAGDLAHGPRLLIDAVASGKRCALSVYGYLTGRKLEPRFNSLHLDLKGYKREADYEKLARTAIPAASVEERAASQTALVERGYDGALAVREACRCLDCGVNTIFDSEKCILCGGCADVCPELCLRLVSCDRLAGDPALAELLQARSGGADLSGMSAIVKDENKCIRCALCAERCPVGAITMERFCFSSEWAVANPT
ncbi:MAG: FAD-dependent oxidoreductase [Planctomycetes bacterium]|nr:FAD-dependent oxidoreductase [Planctomycetota bacterium]